MFLIAAPIAFLAFLATWLIPQVELRTWAAPAAPAAAADAQPTDAVSGADDHASAEDTSVPPLAPESLDPQDIGHRNTH